MKLTNRMHWFYRCMASESSKCENRAVCANTHIVVNLKIANLQILIRMGRKPFLSSSLELKKNNGTYYHHWGFAGFIFLSLWWCLSLFVDFPSFECYFYHLPIALCWCVCVYISYMNRMNMLRTIWTWIWIQSLILSQYILCEHGNGSHAKI